jgi:hypothetical protein
MPSEDHSNTADARANQLEPTAMAFARAVHHARNMRMASYAEGQRSGVDNRGSATAEAIFSQLANDIEELLSPLPKPDSDSIVPESRGNALPQALNDLILMRKNLYDKERIYVYASQSSMGKGAVLSTLVSHIQRIITYHPRGESQGIFLSPAHLSALRDVIEVVHGTGIFTEQRHIWWWTEIQGQLQKILELLPPEPVDVGANGDIGEPQNEVSSSGRPSGNSSLQTSLASAGGTATPSQGITVSGSQATIKHGLVWPSPMVPHCWSKVKQLFHSMLRSSSVQARGQNQVLKLAQQWSEMSEPGQSLWRIFESENRTPASGSRDDFILLAQLCGGFLNSRTRGNRRTIRFVWVHLITHPADVLRRRASAEVLTRALEVLQIFAESVIASEVDFSSDGAETQPSASLISQVARSGRSDSQTVDAHVAYGYFQRSLNELESMSS